LLAQLVAPLLALALVANAPVRHAPQRIELELALRAAMNREIYLSPGVSKQLVEDYLRRLGADDSLDEQLTELASRRTARMRAMVVKDWCEPKDMRLMELPDPEPGAGEVAIDVRAIGLAILALGGGRRRVEDRIDYSVGLADMLGVGDEVGPGRPLAIVHARDSAAAEQAAAAIQAAVEIADAPVAAGPLIRDRIAGS